MSLMIVLGDFLTVHDGPEADHGGPAELKRCTNRSSYWSAEAGGNWNFGGRIPRSDGQSFGEPVNIHCDTTLGLFLFFVFSFLDFLTLYV